MTFNLTNYTKTVVMVGHSQLGLATIIYNISLLIFPNYFQLNLPRNPAIIAGEYTLPSFCPIDIAFQLLFAPAP